jgi:enoyl-CoA hydratase/carnithine racemase
VEFSVRAGVAWITLARPASRNRLDAEMLAGLVDACAAAEDADAVRAVVLAARGGAFCVGLPPACGWPERAWPDGVGAVAALSKPVVAALAGETLGWGLALALACDLRIAASTAVLGVPDVAHGRLPGGGVLPRLTRMVGLARALELALLGTRLGAARAAEWGLVSAVTEAARLPEAVESVARLLAERGPVALRLAKEAVVRSLDMPLGDGIKLEQDLYVLLQTTGDRREGIRAFLERRAPHFEGR